MKLKPLPAGYVYRYVDVEVLVVTEVARKVIDAVVLFSAFSKALAISRASAKLEHVKL